MTINGTRAHARSEWMSIHEAATLVGVSPATLRRWSDAGDIRAFTTPGGHRRFSRAAVARLLPTEPVGGRDRDGRRALSRIAGGIDSLPGLDPRGRQAMRRHARRISRAILASAATDAAHTRASLLAEAESSAAEFGVLAASSGVGLRETVEALLGLRGACLRALVDGRPERGGAVGAWAERAAEVAETFDHLVCQAMRAHETASGRS